MKHVTIVVIIAVILVGGFYTFNSYIYNEKQADITVVSDSTDRGEILAIDLAPLAYDGSAIITIKNDEGIPKNIAIPARGFSMCPGFKNVADISSLKVGNKIEVRGEVDSEGVIVPCVSEAHYLRVNNN